MIFASIILATHQIQYLPYSDKVLVIDNDGNQAFYGTYEELLSREKEFETLQLNNIVVDESGDIGDIFTTKYDINNSKKVMINLLISYQHLSNYLSI
jgi:ABC-type multidrug transport system ATPase subunit